MGLKGFFKRFKKEEEDPSLAFLQNGEIRYMKTPEIVLPPVDEHGRFVPKNRPTNGKP